MTLDETRIHGVLRDNRKCLWHMSGKTNLQCFTHFFGQEVQLLPIFEILKALAFALECFQFPELSVWLTPLWIKTSQKSNTRWVVNCNGARQIMPKLQSWWWMGPVEDRRGKYSRELGLSMQGMVPRVLR